MFEIVFSLLVIVVYVPNSTIPEYPALTGLAFMLVASIMLLFFKRRKCY